MGLPWEALEVLQQHSENVRDTDTTYYMYLEDDMEIPAGTFDFWHRHNMDLFDRRFLLVPHRRVVQYGEDVVETWNPNCFPTLHAFFDKTGPPSLYWSQTDRTYIGGGTCEAYTAT